MGRAMSNTQDKKKARMEEAQAFIKERRQLQYDVLEHNFNVGVKVYESNKDKMSEEEIEKIESMMAEQKAALERIRLEAYPTTKA
jgi:hypothetical protein